MLGGLMKTRIFVFPTHCDSQHTPGVDYVRLIRPMQELAKHPDFDVVIFDGKMKLDWQEVAENFDILYLNYMTLAWDFALMGMLMRKHHKKIVFDIDDLIWEIKEDNSSYDTYKKGSEGRAIITDIVNECDFITTTNNYLKNGLIHHTNQVHERVHVLPNYIDLDLYKHRTTYQDKNEVKIGYFGSSSHFIDLGDAEFTKGVDKLMQQDPRVSLFTIGAMIQQHRKRWGKRYQMGFGHRDLYTWVDLMPKLLADVDLFAVPLQNTVYDRCKSSVKYLEMSSMGIPGVYQDIRQYREIIKDGENGFLAGTAKDWHKKLNKLVSDPELRKRMGQNAYETVKKDWTIQGNINKWVEFFKKVIDTQAK